MLFAILLFSLFKQRFAFLASEVLPYTSTWTINGRLKIVDILGGLKYKRPKRSGNPPLYVVVRSFRTALPLVGT